MLDLRSDVLAGPTEEMWVAMRSAERGWATFGEDRNVAALEARGAERLGKEAALLVPTCSMANLVAMLTLAERGTQAILESRAHIVTSEAWGVASVAGLFPRALEAPGGCPAPEAVAAAIEEARARRLPRTSVVCLENTHTNAGGEALTPEQTAAVAAVSHRGGAAVYLDGARLFNAAVALGVPVARLAEPADAVAVSLNKGLAVPFGALLAGTRRFVEEARLNLKRLGGASLHNAGLLAAAGLLALTDEAVARLADDHRRAACLAERLAGVPGLRVLPARVRTNLVLVDTSPCGHGADEVLARLEQEGVRAFRHSPSTLRFVTHRLVDDAGVERAAAIVSRVVGRLSGVAPRA